VSLPVWARGREGTQPGVTAEGVGGSLHLCVAGSLWKEGSDNRGGVETMRRGPRGAGNVLGVVKVMFGTGGGLQGHGRGREKTGVVVRAARKCEGRSCASRRGRGSEESGAGEWERDGEMSA